MRIAARLVPDEPGRAVDWPAMAARSPIATERELREAVVRSLTEPSFDADGCERERSMRHARGEGLY